MAARGSPRGGRRAFLRNAGLGAGLLATAAISPDRAGSLSPAASATARTSDGPATIGVLLPASRLRPDLGAHFLEGLRRGLGDADCCLPGESSGIGIRSTRAALDRLLALASPALVVGVLGPALAAHLADHPALATVPLVAANVGELLPRATSSPGVFQHTLSSWQAAWALGHWAATNVGRRAAIATSFHDSGYDLPLAFRRGFEGAGGTVALTHITHLPPETGAASSPAAGLVAARPDVVFASYCAAEAADFIRAYADAGLAGRIPLLGGTFLTDATVLAAVGDAAAGIVTAAAWADEGEGPAAASRDPFALLGQETGLLLRAVFAATGGATDAAALRAALATAAFAAPRGRIAMQPATLATLGPVFLREVRAAEGSLANVARGELARVPDARALGMLPGDGLRSGWLNTYFCS